jgi:hypothetical protein
MKEKEKGISDEEKNVFFLITFDSCLIPFSDWLFLITALNQRRNVSAVT